MELCGTPELEESKANLVAGELSETRPCLFIDEDQAYE